MVVQTFSNLRNYCLRFSFLFRDPSLDVKIDIVGRPHNNLLKRKHVCVQIDKRNK
jgi:hypothetical protein